MRKVAIIQARMESSRLPGKVMMPLAGKPLLWHIVYRLKQCRLLDAICLAVADSRANDILVEFARGEEIEVFRGSEENVLERYYLAAKHCAAEAVVRVNGDVPLLDPGRIDELLAVLEMTGAGLVTGDPEVPGIHQGFTPFSFETLEKLYREVKDDPVAKEHVSSYLEKNPGFVKTVRVKPLPEHCMEGVRLSVDTPADLRFLEELYRRLGVAAGRADITEVVRLLRREPELLAINAHVRQKQAGALSRRVLFRCDGDEQVGFGHIFRSLALAGELRDGFGCGVGFVMARGEKGMKVVRGAGYPVKVVEGPEESYLEGLVREEKTDVIVFDCRSGLNKETLELLKTAGALVVTVDDPEDKRLAVDLAFYPPVPQVVEMDWSGFKGRLYRGWEWVILRRDLVAGSGTAGAENDAGKRSVEEEVGRLEGRENKFDAGPAGNSAGKPRQAGENFDHPGESGFTGNSDRDPAKTGEAGVVDDRYVNLNNYGKKEKPVLLVTMGGSDPCGLTLQALESLELVEADIFTEIVVGPGFGDGEKLKEILEGLSIDFRVHAAPENPGAVFARCDLALAAFGVTAYELAHLGVPTLLLAISADHARSASAFEQAGIALNLGLYSEVDKVELAGKTGELLVDRARREQMARRAKHLVDGRGARRAAEVIIDAL